MLVATRKLESALFRADKSVRDVVEIAAVVNGGYETTYRNLSPIRANHLSAGNDDSRARFGRPHRNNIGMVRRTSKKPGRHQRRPDCVKSSGAPTRLLCEGLQVTVIATAISPDNLCIRPVFNHLDRSIPKDGVPSVLMGATERPVS